MASALSPVQNDAARRSQFNTTVLHNVPLCREHYHLVLRTPRFPRTEPGQFIQVACRDLDDSTPSQEEADWLPGRYDAEGELSAPSAYLRRPFSLAGRRDTPDGVELDLIHRVVGVGTDWLARLQPGDTVGILGPLGNRFQVPPPGTTCILVGGGVGIPPLLYLAERVAGRAFAFAGAVTRDLLPLTLTARSSSADETEPAPVVEEFSRHGIPTVVTTDDGSYGFRGFVTQALERYLDGRHGPGSNQPAVVFTCGPEPMMKRVAEIAAVRDLECQVAVERAMACGMGTCQSCCIRVRKPDPTQPPLVGRDWCYRLACTDGPIFRGADLLW
jgi:dihydroorotate dehydrogenase electron transfer subunit